MDWFEVIPCFNVTTHPECVVQRISGINGWIVNNFPSFPNSVWETSFRSEAEIMPSSTLRVEQSTARNMTKK